MSGDPRLSALRWRFTRPLPPLIHIPPTRTVLCDNTLASLLVKGSR